jgi:hypothetical protein
VFVVLYILFYFLPNTKEEHIFFYLEVTLTILLGVPANGVATEDYRVTEEGRIVVELAVKRSLLLVLKFKLDVKKLISEVITEKTICSHLVTTKMDKLMTENMSNILFESVTKFK